LRTATSVQSAESRAVAFGQFTFDRASRLLSRDGVELPLPPRVLGVLTLLLERPGEIVTKQELIAAVWRDAFVTETSLAEAVSVLRQALRDDPQHPTYIQTLHRRGYRFIAELQDALPRSRNGDRAVASIAAAADLERPPRLSLLAPWLIALFAMLTAGVAVWRYVDTAAPPPLEPVRFSIALPSGLTVTTAGAPVAVSHDGRLIAFAACRESACGIYLRPLSQAEPTPVAGTAGATSPFFSPDGRSLGYFAGGRLQSIALAGGSPVPLADAAEPLGAAWLRDGQIVFARSTTEGLFTVGENGGGVQPLTRPMPGEGGHRWPAASPDNSALVFTVAANREYAGAVSMRTRTWGRLLDDVTAARVPVPGFLVAQRGSDLVASIFDERARSITGLPVPVAILESARPIPQFAMSAAGTLVVAPPGATAMQVLLEWTGELRRLVPAPQPALPR
jgi:DNA-binding winged helix-turn-helix (wHTH) protein